MRSLVYLLFTCLLCVQLPIFGWDTATLEEQELLHIATRRDAHTHYDLHCIIRNFMGEAASRIAEDFDLVFCQPFWCVDNTTVYKVGVDFHRYSGYTDLEGARTILKNIAYELLLAMDQDPLLRPYLATYPVPPCVLELSIRFHPSGCNTYPFPGNVAVVTLNDDRIKYESASPYPPYFMKYAVEQISLPARY